METNALPNEEMFFSDDLELDSGEQDSSVDFDFSRTRVPPHSLEAEQSVLGSILISADALNQAVELLQSGDFYVGAHRAIMQAMVEMFETQEPVDVVSVAQSLRKSGALEKSGGVEYLSRLIDIVPTAANIGYYCRVVRSMALRRKVISHAAEITEEAFKAQSEIDVFIDSVETRIMEISDSRARDGAKPVSEIVRDTIKDIERRYVSKESVTGVPTGFVDLDMLTSGLQPSDLIIIAGRPAMGKTSLAMSIARYVALDTKRPVAVFSLEMSREQIVTRFLCSDAKVDNSRVRNGNLRETEFQQLVDAASRVYQAPLWIDDAPAVSVMELRAKARRIHRSTPNGLSLIVIDYLQLMRGSTGRNERREQEISEISRGLKALAKELHLPVLALSQLNRSVESRTDRRPLMSDLRESGAIEQDADIIGFVYRDEVYNPETQDKGIAELIISKHRNGSIGTIKLAFLNEYTLFENLSERADYDYLGADFNFSAEEDDQL